MHHLELVGITDCQLVSELQSRGVLKAERRTVAVPNGIEALVRYSTGWKCEDEIVVPMEDGEAVSDD